MEKNKFKIFFVFFSIAVIFFSVLLALYFNYYILDVAYINFDFKVREDKQIGFNLDQDALHFGIIPPGSRSHRDLMLKSEVPAQVLVKIIGSDYVYPNANDFLIEPNTSVALTFTAAPPNNMPKGNYSGRIRLVFKRA